MPAASVWVQVQPRSGKTEVVGWHGDAVKIRLKAPPVDGAANEELIRFLSKVVGVPRNAVEIASGATGRRKHIKIDGVEPGRLKTALGI